jgi:hypothetical protein
MEENANRLPKRLIWGVGASVLLHVLFLVGFLLTWPVPTPDAPKEEVVNVSIEQPPQEKQKDKPEEKAKDEAQKQPPPEVKPKPAPKLPVPEQRPIETFPPPPGPQAFESAQKDEEAPKEEEGPVPPSSEQPAPEETKPQEAGSGIVAEQRFSLGEGAEQGPPTASVPTPEPKPKLQTALANMKPAKRIYSKDTLYDPRFKEALGRLPAKNRIVQLCGTEMIEQVRHNILGSAPESLAKAVNTKDQIESDVMTITNAVYRSRGEWYSVSLHCETDTKTTRITSFKFTTITPIPRSEWEALGLRPN